MSGPSEPSAVSSSSKLPSFPPPASQPQLLRAHQRDTTQILRLSHLCTELLRSVVGTRWLLTRQHWVDLVVRAAYLLLLFGRGQRTLGEEYTDILPVRAGKRVLSRQRRLMTILFLLVPSLLVSPPATSALQGHDDPQRSATRWQRLRQRLSAWLQTPLGQALPEVHMLLFLWFGRYLEFGKRLTGIRYISTLPHPPRKRPSYEPLGLLLLLPLFSRLLQPVISDSAVSHARPPSALHPPRPSATVREEAEKTEPTLTLPPSPPLTPPPLLANPLSLDARSQDPDRPNTYLTPDARKRPERQCTLCLEPRGTGEGSRGTTAVTECGHVFCWGCLGGLGKPECPLCRQEVRMERVIAAYNL